MATRVLITGSNSGLGYLTALHLSLRGDCDVLLACRTVSKAKEAAVRINSTSTSTSSLAVPIQAPLDLLDPTTVHSFVDHVAHHHGPIDVLINNAGVFLSEKFKETTMINAIAPTLLTTLLKPTTRTVSIITAPKGQASIDYPRVADLNGTSFNQLIQYFHSKQLLSCAMTHLASQKIGGQHVLLGPGSVDTGIHSKDLLAATPFWIKAFMKLNTFFYHGTPESASASIVNAAIGAFDGVPTAVEDVEDVKDVKDVKEVKEAKEAKDTDIEEASNDGVDGNSVQVVDLGIILDEVLCHNVVRNRELYEALMDAVGNKYL